MDMKPKVIVICGPTASGKTSLSIELAKQINGEIISADSMQIYKDMDIGTAKPSTEEMQGIKHYLLDFVPPEERYSVAQYKIDAKKAIKEILEKGKVPIIVGGTGLYVDSLIYEIEYNDIKLDEEYRKKLEEIVEKQGLEVLYKKAQEIDPQAMQKISANDKKRIMRVIEIYKATGKTKTEQEIESRKKPVEYDYKVFAINWEREILYQRINKRVDIMLEQGLIEEVKSIISNCYYMKKDYQNAIKYLKMQEETESNIIDQVRIYNDWEHFQDSIDLIHQSIEKHPTWRLYLLLGTSYQSLEKFEEARNAYIEAFHISKIPTILGSVTEIDRIQRNEERSFQFLLKELENTNNPTAQIQLRLGEMALRVGKSYDEMLDYFKKAYENGAISELEYLDYICDYEPNISELSKRIKKNIKSDKFESYYSKRKQAIRYLYGENGFKQNLKKSFDSIKECLEEYSDDSCDYALLGRFYELSNNYSLALENYQKAYELIKDDDYPGCDCAYGYYAHALLNGIGTNKNVDEAKKIILDAVRKSNTFSCSHVVYYYAYFALQNDERFSKEKAYELLTFDYPFYRFDISRVVSLTQICKSLNRSSSKLEELKKYVNTTYYNKEELQYYDANKDQIVSLPYWKNI